MPRLIRVYLIFLLIPFSVLVFLILLVQFTVGRFASGEQVAFYAGPGVYLWDGRLTLKISDHYLEGAPLWSNDGRLVWNTGSEVYVWERGKLNTLPSSEAFYGLLQWSDDGKLALMNILPGGFLKIGVWAGEEITYVGQQLHINRQPIWSPDGWLAWMMYRDDQWSLYIWDGEKTFNIESTWENEDILGWSNDGQLAWRRLRSDRSEIYVWNRQTVERVYVEHSPKVIAPPVWSSDNQLAWLINDGNEFQVCIWTDCTTPAPGIASRLTWSNDGRLAWEGESNVASNSDIFVWDGNTVTNVSQHPDEEYVPMWSKDGLLAWTVYEGGTNSEVFVWDGEQVINISDNPDGDVSPRWLDNGALLWMSNRHQGRYSAYLWHPGTAKPISLSAAIGYHEFSPVWFIRE